MGWAKFVEDNNEIIMERIRDRQDWQVPSGIDSRYREAEVRTINGYNLQCIDGSTHGRSRCVGYCSYEGHPGFLTADHRKKHLCSEKGCHYYSGKPATARARKQENPAADILNAAKAATADLEGLKVLRTDRRKDGAWNVYFAAIAQYPTAQIAIAISSVVGWRVYLRQIQCDFDVAASLVMN